ncbi:adenosylmethionine--8-amino-7-oxononanoate transaminase [Blautia wexlerae]|jgi:adenosylmethionine-8-amino-7-oxononanoate aminotransferase|uniref:adenosylmethionine--8-amino-7-oxononanoate transaminase n=5 Tax=Blautia TaxID=572511 RepID=UPI000E50C876|nr:adenosylmethionine--8-amino-7-oxononanoate transaminase [Blautia wexlerae]RHO44022.1 adenosylmethionine--8-amino-7-oxononanoate transaminase [Ruminococcus sp. AM12-48]
MIWYPYEQMKTMKAPYKILDAEGVHLYTKDQKLIDSISSWWCMIHGYKHPELTEAIKEQADRFCHVMLGGLTHEPVEKLSAKLQEFLPGDLDYCFFSDSGSVAVEVSLKMALQYNTNQGRKRPLVLALEHAYHGDTFKAMEVGDDEDYHFAFDKKEGVVHIPTEIPALEEAFEQYHDRLNCFIVEPLLQGAGGMRMYDISFLKRARELCDQYDVLLIFDEVATGFGRTGNRFVADLVLPDILVLGKALTGGYIGHAVTVANHKVFDAFYSDDDRLALMHGPTFMGNPLACAVALKGIEIFEREDYMSKIRHIEQVSRREMEAFTDPRIKEVRIMGGCVCVEVHDSRDLEGFQQFAYERGVFSRPFLNYMYSMVPYVIRDEELIRIFDVMKEWFTLEHI